MKYETHISTQQDQTKKNVWIPREDENRQRPEDHQPTQKNRQKAPHPRLSRSFPKTSRLLCSQEFKLVCREGRRYFTPSLNFIYTTSKQNFSPKLGLSVSRKAGNSVHRNYFKRIIRELFRTHSSLLPPGLQFQISPRKKVKDISFAEIQLEFETFLKKVNL